MRSFITSPDITGVVKKGGMRWARHVARMGEINVYETLVIAEDLKVEG
jgi:hypothetical protein